MGSITRSFANNIGSSGILTASAVTNATVEDVTSFDNAASNATLVLLSTQTASSSASISFTTGLDSTYDEYIFKFIDIHPSSNNKLSINFSTDGGANYNVTKTTTTFGAIHNESDTVTSLAYATNDDVAQSTGDAFLHQIGIGTANDASLSASLTLFNPSSTVFVKHFISNVQLDSSNDGYSANALVAGYANTTSAVNAVIFRMNSGNIDDGIIKLYGVKKS